MDGVTRAGAIVLSILFAINLGMANKELLELWQYWYLRVGIVMPPLLILAGITLAILGAFLFAPAAICHHRDFVNKLLNMTLFSSPTLGLIGTLLGLQQGLAHFLLAADVEQLIKAVGAVVQGLTVSLTSTLWGAVIALCAGVIQIFVIKKPKQMAIPDAYEPSLPNASAEDTSESEDTMQCNPNDELDNLSDKNQQKDKVPQNFDKINGDRLVDSKVCIETAPELI